MTLYKGFDFNGPSTLKPWGSREEQAWKDMADTIVKDAIIQTKDTLHGHRHWALYDPNGAVNRVHVGSSSRVFIQSEGFTYEGTNEAYTDPCDVNITSVTGDINLTTTFSDYSYGSIFLKANVAAWGDGYYSSLTLDKEGNAAIESLGGMCRVHNVGSGMVWIYSDAGNVQIDSNGGELDINSVDADTVITSHSGNMRIRTTGSGNHIFLNDSGADPSSFVGIGFGSPASMLDVYGNIHSSGDIFTTILTDWHTSANVQGFSSLTSNYCRYKKIGKRIDVWFNFAGVSNDTFIRFTAPETATGIPQSIGIVSLMTDNSVVLSTNGVCLINGSGTTIYVYKDGTGGAWTASNNKGCTGHLSYEIA
jgi:hypothetical protein